MVGTLTWLSFAWSDSSSPLAGFFLPFPRVVGGDGFSDCGCCCGLTSDCCCGGGASLGDGGCCGGCLPLISAAPVLPPRPPLPAPLPRPRPFGELDALWATSATCKPTAATASLLARRAFPVTLGITVVGAAAVVAVAGVGVGAVAGVAAVADA